MAARRHCSPQPDAADAGLAGGLYLVAVPIGNAADITRRALDTLRRADILACEDTRSFRRLATLCDIPLRGRHLHSYHDRSRPAALAKLRDHLAAGAAVAYAPEAGTPLISDPGYRLVHAAIELGVPVVPVPGASAVTAALTASGLPTDRFLFAGFPPSKKSARQKFFAELRDLRATLVFYESPHRLAASLADLHATLGDRPVAILRELTKKFEETRRGRLSEFVDAEPSPGARGEHVIVVGEADEKAPIESRELSPADLDGLSTRDAARELAARTGESRSAAYRRLLKRGQPG